MSYQAAVITVSDRASAGVYEDKSGPAVAAMLKEAGYEVVYTSIVPDEQEKISEELIFCVDEKPVGILVLVNGKIVVEPAARLGGIFIVANGIHRLIRAYARHQRLPVFSGIGNIIIGLISVFFPAATLALLSFIFSLYVFLNALVKFIDFGTALKNAVPVIALNFGVRE